MISAFIRCFVAGMACVLAVSGSAQADDATCPAKRDARLVPSDPALCAALDDVVRKPGALPLGEYETKLGDYFRNYCHRRPDAGWVPDKSVRDTGPYTATLTPDGWQAAYHGTHAPVLIWYSPEMAEWVRHHRGADDGGTGKDAAPVPDGAIIVKEMYPAPASHCASVDPFHLEPTSGAAVMVRAAEVSHDGWFWGWFGWSGWTPDYPASNADNRLAYMGFGQYCVNCHASARDNLTFSSARNMKGDPGEPLVFLSMDEHDHADHASHHKNVVAPPPAKPHATEPLKAMNPAMLVAFPPNGDLPTAETVSKMPSETYDNVWMPAGAPTTHGQYLTSDQCMGCHDAGSTGLHFDMTVFDEAAGKLVNNSPYATWRTSPMGLAGRDPIFFAQLASETQSFHPDEADMVENTCLGCHGIMGQRQFGIDQHKATGACGTFTRDHVNAVPYPPDNPLAPGASYGALARDGISCMACHHMVLGEEASKANRGKPQNVCVDERQEALNPDATGFGRTFTGSFLVGAPDELYGPFEDPKTAPMQASLGITPQHSTVVKTSELCGTCHTVHLPVLHNGETVAHVYEQTTYPEWAFSAYRTGTSPDGPLPHGAGGKAQECQACHMPSANEDGTPVVSKIASIQEHQGFPEADFTRAATEINLEAREGFAKHTLVGLNVFLVKMAEQFPDVLGLRAQDPMLVSKGIDPVNETERQMLGQASAVTASLAVGDMKSEDDVLTVPVTVTNNVGHKFPSGVGFRRAFVSFEVLDAGGKVIWASGRTDGAGRLVDQNGAPIDGEIWWQADCSARLDPLARKHQPQCQSVSRQNQAQIYQELVSTPPPDGQDAVCGHDAAPAGQLTTSFLSICAEVKDNRLLPSGYLPEDQRRDIAKAFGAGDDLAADAGSTAVGDDPDYVTGGGDSITYDIPLDDIEGAPANVRARLYYQATPPFYLQDRFCSAKGPDRDRLYYLAGHLNLEGTPAEGWKLLVADTGVVAVPVGKKTAAK